MTYYETTRTAQRLLDAWPDVPKEDNLHGCARRFRDALLGMKSGEAAVADVTSLARQIILDGRARGSANELLFRRSAELPDATDWSRAGCHAMTIGDRSRITAEWWHPPTTDDISGRHATEDIREIHRGEFSIAKRHLKNLDADPFWQEALGYPTYVSTGQRQAARSVALAPPGSTTVVCLPTGHGKTAVVQAPILLDREGQGVSIVVVPTVVLALDMERRFKELVRDRHLSPSSTDRYAYTGDLPDEIKSGIRDEIRQGSQRVVFTSPEALTSALRPAVETAAREGRLRYFVIDEAHLVEQWGNEFRPEFQSISHLHRRCLQLAPSGREPVTVTMSATLTTHQITTLTDLFGGIYSPEVVWAAQLRHEPSYYVSRFEGEDERTAAVLEAVVKLPKPMVLYVSRKEDAPRWAELLRDHGLNRTAVVTGDNDDGERRDALEGWAGRAHNGAETTTRYDIVIGTSAFGVGVDLNDVRSVIHACLPETIDRYYQEVGRGGRDGHPCIAYLAVAESDLAIARSLGQQKLLTAETALKRWNAMYATRERLGTTVYRLDTNARTAQQSEGYERHRTWNIRLLNLMTRSGLIEFNDPTPPESDPSSTSEQRAALLTGFYERYGDHVDVTITDTSLFDEKVFSARINATRDAIHHANDRATNAILDVRSNTECIGTLLSKHYAVARNGVSLHPGVTCRGCPACRRAREASNGFFRLAPEPYPFVAGYEATDLDDPLARHRGPYSHVSLRWSAFGTPRWEIERVLRELVGRGVRVVGGPGAPDSLLKTLQRELRPAPIIADRDDSLLVEYPGTVVWVASPEDDPWPADLIARLNSVDRTYVVHSESDWETRATYSRAIPFFPSHSITTVLEHF